MKELRLRSFENNPNFGFLSDNDKYLFRTKKDPIKIGIIGTGTIGLEHIRIASLDESSHVQGIFDLDPNVADYAVHYTERFFGHRTTRYESLAGLASDSQIDALIICTPNHTHLSVFNEIALFQKPIYIEKPMAHTLRDAITLYQAAKAHKAEVHIGLQYRYKPQYVQSIQTLQELKSQPLHIQITEHRPPFLDKVNQWNKYNHYTGGTLIEKCCHYFNLMQLFANSRPSHVFCMTNQAFNFKEFNTQDPADGIDSAQVMVKFENQALANLSLCMFSPSFFEQTTLCCPNVKIQALEEMNPILNRKRTELEVIQDEEGICRKYQPEYGQAITESGHNGSTYQAHKEFIAAIRKTKRHFIRPASLEESLWSIAIGDAAQRSAQQGITFALRPILEEHGAGFLFE